MWVEGGVPLTSTHSAHVGTFCKPSFPRDAIVSKGSPHSEKDEAAEGYDKNLVKTRRTCFHEVSHNRFSIKIIIICRLQDALLFVYGTSG